LGQNALYDGRFPFLTGQEAGYIRKIPWNYLSSSRQNACRPKQLLLLFSS
jgi:hypothetical protein